MRLNDGGGLLILLIAFGVWYWLGDPQRTIAGWFWTDSSAPWEDVDAFYYPDSSDLTKYKVLHGLSDIDDCREWVGYEAARLNDSQIRRGDYECAVGEPKMMYGMPVYRITVR